jgi:signal peptidase II
MGGILYIVNRIPEDKKYRPLYLVSVLIFAGAIGNFIDRLKQQYVVDFIYFSPIDFPVFNVADIYVTCGCALMIVLFLFYYKDDDFSFIKNGKQKKTMQEEG